MVRLREYYQDPNTPRAHDVLPAAFAAVRNRAGQLLLVRRIDDGNWELPGGRIEVGETAATTVVREVAEESGITIELTGLAGVYSDPTHVLVDPDDTIHQQLALCFHAVPAAPTDADQPRPDHDETDAAAWFSISDIDNLKIHPASCSGSITPSAASRRIAPSTSEVWMTTGSGTTVGQIDEDLARPLGRPSRGWCRVGDSSAEHGDLVKGGPAARVLG